MTQAEDVPLDGSVVAQAGSDVTALAVVRFEGTKGNDQVVDTPPSATSARAGTRPVW